MKLGFILDAKFDVLSAFTTNVPDSIARVIFLAIELAKLGHNITIFSHNNSSLTAFDVRCRNMNIVNQALNLDKAILEPDYNALIVVDNSPEFIVGLRQALPYKTMMFLWTELSAAHPFNNRLSDAQVLEQIDGIICVSDWQRTSFLGKFPIPRDKLAVRLNAISPAFENLFIDGKEFVQYKSKIPLFGYLSRPTYGLEILLETFPDVLNNYPAAALNLYEPNLSADTDTGAEERIYALAEQAKGMHRIKNISSTQLAARLRTHTIMAYPNTVEETKSTAILNAMAAGLYVITSNVGALPEYCTEHGKCILAKNLLSDSLDSFIGQVLAVCQSQTHSPSAFYDYCFKQTVDMNKKHTWGVRAREWVNLLSNAT